MERALERGRFVHLDGPSRWTRHLNLEEVLPAKSERLRISGTRPLTCYPGGAGARKLHGVA
jgi:hypothetical protein